MTPHQQANAKLIANAAHRVVMLVKSKHAMSAPANQAPSLGYLGPFKLSGKDDNGDMLVEWIELKHAIAALEHQLNNR